MKISKLFHWLYAIAMLLPVFAVGFACLTAVFNEQAYTTNTYEIQYEYETNDVNLSSDLIEGNIYTFTFDNSITTQARIGIDYVILDDDISEYNLTTILNSYDPTIRINYTYSGTVYPVFVVIPFNTTNNAFTTNQPINFIYGNSQYNSNIETLIPMISRCENVPIVSVNETTDSTYDVFYYAVDKMTHNTMFSWAYDSFLTAPIEYIVDLFSMPVDSPVVLMLSYWLTISIVWLCFDLIMYVPLLVHRWIDKGVLE